jgi:RNA polymerase sigma-70 factor (ECF subfamily)
MTACDAARSEASRAAERAARDAYGRMVASLAFRWRDLAAAEDALADAFSAALERWPRDGVPQNPQAWLVTAAKRRLLEAARHARVERDPRVTALHEDEPQAPVAPDVPDERLRLMCLCVHPALPASMHAPLMLQAVLGLDASTIAAAFLVSPSAMAQRLVRAKARIREAGLRVGEPEAREWPQRLPAVLEGIYGAYTLTRQVGAAASAGGADDPGALAQEAVFLGRLVASLRPEAAEAWGLLALMLYGEARRDARFDARGRFVPLGEQDPARWSRTLHAQAERSLRHAATLRSPGPYQLEAAIQSAHCQRAWTGTTPWTAIASLYDSLVAHFPSAGARIGRAVALGETGRVAEGLAALDAIEPALVAGHQPWWVARSHLLRLAGRAPEAADATMRAVGLTEDARVRTYLLATASRP